MPLFYEVGGEKNDDWIWREIFADMDGLDPDEIPSGNTLQKGMKDHFRSLPDDAMVSVFHGTKPEVARSIIRDGVVSVPELVRLSSESEAPHAMYVAPSAEIARRYGPTVITFRVPKSHLHPAPESEGAELEDAFFHPDQGATINEGTIFEASVIKNKKKVLPT